MKTYIVYDHVSPNGKHYIGQTCQSVNKRWGKDGKKYLDRNRDGEYIHAVFAKAIIKYGWDNFQHDILFHNCSKQLADKLERAFIKYYKNLGLSYNIADGGGGGAKKLYTEEQLQLKNKERCKRNYETHKEDRLAKCHQYYIEHRDEKLKYQQQYQQEHHAEYYQKNAERFREYSRNYHREHRESCLAKQKEYWKKHRDELLAKRREKRRIKHLQKQQESI